MPRSSAEEIASHMRLPKLSLPDLSIARFSLPSWSVYAAIAALMLAGIGVLERLIRLEAEILFREHRGLLRGERFGRGDVAAAGARQHAGL